MRFRSPLRHLAGTSSSWPHLAEIHHAIYPGIFIEPFAGGAGTSIIIVHGESNAGLLIDQNPAVAAFWREAIETFEVTRKAAAFMDMRGRSSDQVESLERDPSFWAYIQPLFSPGNDLISGHSEKARHDLDIENLVEFLKQIHLVSGRVRILEADAWELLDQYARDSEEFAFFAAPYVECGKFEYDSYAYDQKWLVKMLAGWKGRWLFSYDRPNHLVKIVFLRPAASSDCSSVSWMTPMAVNFHPPTRQASHFDDR